MDFYASSLKEEIVLTRSDSALNKTLQSCLNVQFNKRDRSYSKYLEDIVNGLLSEFVLEEQLGAVLADGISFDLTLPDDNRFYDCKTAVSGLKSKHGFISYYSKKLKESSWSKATGLIAIRPIKFSMHQVKSENIKIWETASIFYVGPLV